MTAESSSQTPTDVDTVLYAVGDDLRDAEFDEDTHVWTVRGRRARIVIATDGALPAMSADRADRPYLGVAVHGVPNFFLICGPDAAARKSYVAKCLAHLSRTECSRIEVRSSTQRVYNDRPPHAAHRGGRYWRRVGKRIPSAFEVRAHDGGQGCGGLAYEGPAKIVIDGLSHDAQARLIGRIEPIDGFYHWQGTVSDSGLEVRLPQHVDVVIGDRTARGRLTERTPWSAFSVSGTGVPPFAPDEIDVGVPLR